jgi:hypothetical protein
VMNIFAVFSYNRIHCGFVCWDKDCRICVG